MATVIDSVTIAPDCKKLTVIASGDSVTVNFTYYNYITETTVTSGPLATTGGNVTWILDNETAGELFNLFIMAAHFTFSGSMHFTFCNP